MVKRSIEQHLRINTYKRETTIERSDPLYSRESEAVMTEYKQTKCKTDRRAACLGKRLFEVVRLSESRRRTTVGKG